MPFFDRHWQLRRVGAVLAAVPLSVRYLQVAAIWDAHFGWDLTPDVIFALCSATALAATAILLARSIAPARDRHEYRRAVIEGREWPPKEKAEHAPRGEPPLVVVQRISLFDRGFGCFAALMTIVDIVIAAIMIVWMVRLLLGASAAQIGI